MSYSCANGFSQHPGPCEFWCGDERICPQCPAHIAELARKSPMPSVVEAAPNEPVAPLPSALLRQMRSFLLAHRPDDGSPVDQQFGKMLTAISEAERASPP